MRVRLPDSKPYAFIATINIMNKDYKVIIAPITKEQEEELDSDGSIEVKGYGLSLKVDNTNKYCYGEIDFGNEEDIEIIDSCKWIQSETHGIVIPKDYKLKDNTCEANLNGILHSETFDNLRIAEYAYGSIGKPKRCVIFRVEKKDLKDINYNEEVSY